MKLDKASKMVYVNTEGLTGGNVGVIAIEEYTAVVVAQYLVSGIEFKRSIPAITSKPITHLLLIHYQGDHIFDRQEFEDCEIVDHRLLKEKIEENLTTIWTPEKRLALLEDVRENSARV